MPMPGRPDPCAPQQSLSFVHRSPSTWQPSAGWQIFTPVLTYGAQRRLQQPLQSVHTVPSRPPLQKVAPAGGAPQVPSVAPDAMLQMPPQHCVPVVQTSLFWTQYEELSEQWPAAQSWEQQSPLAAQALPAVLQLALSGTHLPPVQFPPQQSALAVQAWLSEMQVSPAHVPPVQVRAQQSVPVVQVAPAFPQIPAVAVHWCIVGSHVPVQHSEFDWHGLPYTPQRAPAPPSGGTVAELPPPQACPAVTTNHSASAAKMYAQVRPCIGLSRRGLRPAIGLRCASSCNDDAERVVAGLRCLRVDTRSPDKA